MIMDKLAQQQNLHPRHLLLLINCESWLNLVLCPLDMSGSKRQLVISSNDEIWQVGSAGPHNGTSRQIMASGAALKQQRRRRTRL